MTKPEPRLIIDLLLASKGFSQSGQLAMYGIRDVGEK